LVNRLTDQNLRLQNKLMALETTNQLNQITVAQALEVILASNPLTGLNAFHDVVVSKDIEKVKEFINAAKIHIINSRTSDGRTPLHLAVESGWAEGVRTILAGGADRSLLDGNGNSPYAVARESGLHEIARLLAQAAVEAATANPPQTTSMDVEAPTAPSLIEPRTESVHMGGEQSEEQEFPVLSDRVFTNFSISTGA
ncbi:hypothetical protein HDU93_006248, partial [Gonapodya sp. JEL0774]